MLTEKLVRVSEIKDAVEGHHTSDSIFYNFAQSLNDNPAKYKAFLEIERFLNEFDEESWMIVKAEVSLRTKKRDILRGWQQVFDIINCVYAYMYLKSVNMKSVRVIKRGKKKSPDIVAMYNGKKVLCEVKTINRSNRDLTDSNNIVAKQIVLYQEEGFYCKLMCSIEKAITQLNEYDNMNEAKHMVFINVLFDDWVGDYNSKHISSIRGRLESYGYKGIEIVVLPFAFFKPSYKDILVLKDISE